MRVVYDTSYVPPQILSVHVSGPEVTCSNHHCSDQFCWAPASFMHTSPMAPHSAHRVLLAAELARYSHKCKSQVQSGLTPLTVNLGLWETWTSGWILILSPLCKGILRHGCSYNLSKGSFEMKCLVAHETEGPLSQWYVPSLLHPSSLMHTPSPSKAVGTSAFWGTQANTWLLLH